MGRTITWELRTNFADDSAFAGATKNEGNSNIGRTTSRSCIRKPKLTIEQQDGVG